VVLAGRVGSNPTPGAKKTGYPRELSRVFATLSCEHGSQLYFSCWLYLVSDPPPEVEKDPYPLMAKWRQSERAQMIEAIRDMITESRRMATSKRIPARERIGWTRLAGQLIWYKDSILRSMSLESMERELTKLKDEVFVRRRLPDAPPGYERRKQ